MENLTPQVEPLASRMGNYVPLIIIILLLLFIAVDRIWAHRKAVRTEQPQEPVQPPQEDDLPPAPDLRPKHWMPDEPKSVVSGAIHDDFVRLLDRFITIVVKENDVSASVLMQQTGYHQAIKFIDHMEAIGIIGPSRLPLSREIRITDEQYQNILRKRLFRYRTELDMEDVEFVKTLIDRLQRDVTLIVNGVLTADSLNDDLLDDVDLMDGPGFEAWCTELLTKLGYHIEAPEVDDHRHILFAEKEDVLYVLHCQCSAVDLDDASVKETFSAQRYYHRHVGVVMTNRAFIPSTHELAKRLNILLWDRDKLKLLIEKETLLPF